MNQHGINGVKLELPDGSKVEVGCSLPQRPRALQFLGDTESPPNPHDADDSDLDDDAGPEKPDWKKHAEALDSELFEEHEG